MICFPNAKINLGLQVLEKRADGFHNIQSVIAPIAWHDSLEFKETDSYCLTNYGLQLPNSNEENLVTKTWLKMNQYFDVPPLEIHLLKSIPFGAGLGGGSSDSAFFIKEVNKYFGLKMNPDQMRQLAAELGSDCPFFIENETVLATAKGEVMRPVSINLKNYFLVVVKPDLNIATAEAYRLIKPENSGKRLDEIINLPISQWVELLTNDFEKVVFDRFPKIRQIKEKMYQKGALYASMSGSGPSVYGIFEKEVNVEDVFNSYQIRTGFLFLN